MAIGSLGESKPGPCALAGIRPEPPPEGAQYGPHVKDLRMMGSKVNQHHQQGKCRSRVAVVRLWLGDHEVGKRGRKEYASRDPCPTPDFSREKSGANTHMEIYQPHLGVEKFKIKPEGTRPRPLCEQMVLP